MHLPGSFCPDIPDTGKAIAMNHGHFSTKPECFHGKSTSHLPVERVVSTRTFIDRFPAWPAGYQYFLSGKRCAEYFPFAPKDNLPDIRYLCLSFFDPGSDDRNPQLSLSQDDPVRLDAGTWSDALP
jgi:hypothetical protein